ncbi:transposase [Paenibacillus sp. strain BS8-2]
MKILRFYRELRDLTRLRKKRAAEFLFGTLNTHQMLMIRNCWEHISLLEQSIAELDAEIEAHLQPYEEAHTLIQTIPGVSTVTAYAIIAEIGVDMEQFPTVDHLASWAGVAPGNHESAGKKKYTNSQGKSACKNRIM